MKAIRVHEYGDADQLRYEEVDLPEPGTGEARVRIEAAGVNFIDVYHRQGRYPSQPPITPGMEGAGVVDAVGREADASLLGRPCVAENVLAAAELVALRLILRRLSELGITTMQSMIEQAFELHTGDALQLNRGELWQRVS
mgnify:CR=1 FL=1